MYEIRTLLLSKEAQKNQPSITTATSKISMLWFCWKQSAFIFSQKGHPIKIYGLTDSHLQFS